jgi:hypothetical protein
MNDLELFLKKWSPYIPLNLCEQFGHDVGTLSMNSADKGFEGMLGDLLSAAESLALGAQES